jgi:hypothetical protein
MNTVRVTANSNKVTDHGAWVELFAQDNGGAWLRVSVAGQSGRHRSTSVIIPPEGVNALMIWIAEYVTSPHHKEERES